MKHLIIYTTILLMLSNCAGIMKVRQHDGRRWRNARGIPFYTQKQIIKQQTKYLHSWYEIVVLEKDINGGDEKEILKRNISISERSAISFIRSSIGKDGGILTDQQKKDILDNLSSLESPAQEPDSTMVSLIENSWKPEVVVDYDNPYYINGSLPWLGNGTFSQKLNNNGTLAESSAEADTQLDDFITNLLPIDDLLSSLLIPSRDSDSETARLIDSKMSTQLQIKIELKGYVYSFVRIHCKCGDCDQCCETGDCTGNPDTTTVRYFPSIEFDLYNGNFTRSVWERDMKKDEKPKEEKPTISVSGKIELPEEKESK